MAVKHDITYVKDIKEFYKEITKSQQGSHGKEYMHHHNALVKCAKESETIKELGVCQGATLAAMLMTNPKKITGVS